MQFVLRFSLPHKVANFYITILFTVPRKRWEVQTNLILVIRANVLFNIATTKRSINKISSHKKSQVKNFLVVVAHKKKIAALCYNKEKIKKNEMQLYLGFLKIVFRQPKYVHVWMFNLVIFPPVLQNLFLLDNFYIFLLFKLNSPEKNRIKSKKYQISNEKYGHLSKEILCSWGKFLRK